PVLHRNTELAEDRCTDGSDVRCRIDLPTRQDWCWDGFPGSQFCDRRITIKADHDVHQKAVGKHRENELCHLQNLKDVRRTGSRLRTWWIRHGCIRYFWSATALASS